MGLTIIYLGTGAAVPAPGRDNTSLAVDDGIDVTLIDVSGSPARRLLEAGLDVDRLSRVVLTHEHPDHIYGLPSLLQSLWLLGRAQPLAIYALEETWRRVERLLEAFQPASWVDRFPLERHVLVPGDQPFLETERLSFRARAVEHSVPTVALRIEGERSAVVYSSDTGPCPAVQGLARNCSLLIHEATFLEREVRAATAQGHSTARQAGGVAAAAGAERLALVHFTPSDPDELSILRAEGEAAFGGPVDVPGDLDRLELP